MKTPEHSRDVPLAVTMGCPAGVGPEILCRLAVAGALGDVLVIGDAAVLRQAAARLGLSVALVSRQPGRPVSPGELALVQSGPVLSEPITWGQPNLHTARAMAGYIEEAVLLVMKGRCSGLVTCPISKSGLHQAGYNYPGHTEMLAALTGTGTVRMMMAGPRLKVVLATIHVPLREVGSLLDGEDLADCIELTRLSLQRDFGITNPRIAVAGLNPHCGEGGLFGDEEARILSPAIAVAAGRNPTGTVTGPHSPDTVFYQAATGRFDAVIALYHDQGLIPFKLLHFTDGVNVTLGLPLVRTSVDHGTAYDIAGQNLADPSSLAAALDMAHEIVDNRRRREPA
ncbi:MAG: 4-hydroxythreonine-4-phosphate dehydrogenase PdxA [Desulfobulbus sp.]|jgi:4-hydroxythreonine-4-phosphate dehydrogenase